jgi:hypothetical protein
MALSNELSSEIAVALLSATKKTPRELKDLQEVVFRVHNVLNQMDEAQRSARKGAGGSEQNSSSAAVAGGN